MLPTDVQRMCLPTSITQMSKRHLPAEPLELRHKAYAIATGAQVLRDDEREAAAMDKAWKAKFGSKPPPMPFIHYIKQRNMRTRGYTVIWCDVLDRVHEADKCQECLTNVPSQSMGGTLRVTFKDLSERIGAPEVRCLHEICLAWLHALLLVLVYMSSYPAIPSAGRREVAAQWHIYPSMANSSICFRSQGWPALALQASIANKLISAYVNFLRDKEKCHFLLDSPKEEACVVEASILTDVGDKGRWHGPHAPSCGFRLDGSGMEHVRCVAVAPTTTNVFSLLIFPKSHKLLRQAAKHHDWAKEWGFLFSSKEKDQSFCERKSERKPCRIWVDKGEMLVYDGHLVTAIDETRMSSSYEVMPNIRQVWAGAGDGKAAACAREQVGTDKSGG